MNNPFSTVLKAVLEHWEQKNKNFTKEKNNSNLDIYEIPPAFCKISDIIKTVQFLLKDKAGFENIIMNLIFKRKNT